jgi:hypothetical protein
MKKSIITEIVASQDYFKIHKIIKKAQEKCFIVKGYSEYTEDSVLYGTTSIIVLGTYSTEKGARAAYPQLAKDGTEWGNRWFDRELMVKNEDIYS